MRDIKFRGFDKVNKRMFDVHGLGKDWVTEETMDGVNPGVNCWDGDDFEQDIEIMQYTGIKDKNGTEIYEGDILQHNKNRFFVRHSINQHVLLLRDINPKTENWRGLDWCKNVSNYIEVIGDIHENPELL